MSDVRMYITNINVIILTLLLNVNSNVFLKSQQCKRRTHLKLEIRLMNDSNYNHKLSKNESKLIQT